MSRATLTLFCGPPGAGKTTLARRLEAAGRGVRLNTDEWEHALAGGWEDAFHERLQRRLFDHAQELLRTGVDVILEDGLWTRTERAEKISAGRAAGARVELHVFDVPDRVLHERIARRNADAAAGARPVPPAELDHALDIFEPPTAAELAAVDFVVRHGP